MENLNGFTFLKDRLDAIRRLESKRGKCERETSVWIFKQWAQVRQIRSERTVEAERGDQTGNKVWKRSQKCLLIDWMCRVKKREEPSMAPSCWIHGQCHELRCRLGNGDGGQGNMSQDGFFFVFGKWVWYIDLIGGWRPLRGILWQYMLYSRLPCPHAPDHQAILISLFLSLAPSFSLKAHFQVVLSSSRSFLSLEDPDLHFCSPYGLWFQSPHSTSFSLLELQGSCPFTSPSPPTPRPRLNNCKHLSCQKEIEYLPVSFQFLIYKTISLLQFGITHTDLTPSSENSSFLIFLIENQIG